MAEPRTPRLVKDSQRTYKRTTVFQELWRNVFLQLLNQKELSMVQQYHLNVENFAYIFICVSFVFHLHMQEEIITDGWFPICDVHLCQHWHGCTCHAYIHIGSNELDVRSLRAVGKAEGHTVNQWTTLNNHVRNHSMHVNNPSIISILVLHIFLSFDFQLPFLSLWQQNRRSRNHVEDQFLSKQELVEPSVGRWSC